MGVQKICSYNSLFTRWTYTVFKPPHLETLSLIHITFPIDLNQSRVLFIIPHVTYITFPIRRTWKFKMTFLSALVQLINCFESACNPPESRFHWPELKMSFCNAISINISFSVCWSALRNSPASQLPGTPLAGDPLFHMAGTQQINIISEWARACIPSQTFPTWVTIRGRSACGLKTGALSLFLAVWSAEWYQQLQIGVRPALLRDRATGTGGWARARNNFKMGTKLDPIPEVHWRLVYFIHL